MGVNYVMCMCELCDSFREEKRKDGLIQTYTHIHPRKHSATHTHTHTHTHFIIVGFAQVRVWVYAWVCACARFFVQSEDRKILNEEKRKKEN